jgi:hypothetical protein
MATFDSNFEAIISLITGGATLSSVLAAGNTTGDNALVVSNPVSNTNARLQGEDNTANDAVAAGELIIRGGDKTDALSTGNGGDLSLYAGTAAGSGLDGVINLFGNTTVNGDMTVTGTLVTGGTATGISVGSGSPESSVTADRGSIYQRDDSTSLGNALYVKTEDGTNTGWVPLGPRITEEFIAPGGSSTFTLTSSDTFYRNVSGFPEIDVQVFWNGVRLTEGAATGDFAVTASNAIQIRDGAGSPLNPLAGDRITIDYLPA